MTLKGIIILHIFFRHNFWIERLMYHTVGLYFVPLLAEEKKIFTSFHNTLRQVIAPLNYQIILLFFCTEKYHFILLLLHINFEHEHDMCT